jgi:hypothetical protein
MMSPVADLAPVAAAGRAVGERYRAIASVSPDAAELYLKAQLGINVATGGKFDYQRRGPQLEGLANEVLRRQNVNKAVRDWAAEPFIQRRQFRSVSNFNVGLFCQQAGLSLEKTLTLAGEWASQASSNADADDPHGLNAKTVEFIIRGYGAGRSGAFDTPQ